MSLRAVRVVFTDRGHVAARLQCQQLAVAAEVLERDAPELGALVRDVARTLSLLTRSRSVVLDGAPCAEAFDA